MGFRLVPNSVTLDDLERRNSPNRRVQEQAGSTLARYGHHKLTIYTAHQSQVQVISPNSVAFGADYVKVVEDKPFCSGNVGHRI